MEHIATTRKVMRTTINSPAMRMNESSFAYESIGCVICLRLLVLRLPEFGIWLVRRVSRECYEQLYMLHILLPVGHDSFFNNLRSKHAYTYKIRHLPATI